MLRQAQHEVHPQTVFAPSPEHVEWVRDVCGIVACRRNSSDRAGRIRRAMSAAAVPRHSIADRAPIEKRRKSRLYNSNVYVTI